MLVLAFLTIVQAPPAKVQEFKDLGLTITLPALTELAAYGTPNEQWIAGWRGKLDDAQFDISLRVFSDEEFGFTEPDDVNEYICDVRRDPKKGGAPQFAYDDIALLPGPFGFAPYAAYAHADVEHATENKIEWCFFGLGGVLPQKSYSLQVTSNQALTESQSKTIAEFVKKGVVYKGPVRDSKWSDEDARKRWEQSAPTELAKEMKKVTRTAH